MYGEASVFQIDLGSTYIYHRSLGKWLFIGPWKQRLGKRSRSDPIGSSKSRSVFASYLLDAQIAICDLYLYRVPLLIVINRDLTWLCSMIALRNFQIGSRTFTSSTHSCWGRYPNYLLIWQNILITYVMQTSKTNLRCVVSPDPIDRSTQKHFILAKKLIGDIYMKYYY